MAKQMIIKLNCRSDEAKLRELAEANPNWLAAVRLTSRSTSQFINSSFSDYTDNIEECWHDLARRYTGYLGDGSVEYWIKVPRDFKLDIRFIMPDDALGIIRSAPSNPISKGLLLKYMKIPVPDNVKTFTQISKWAVENYKGFDASAEAEALRTREAGGIIEEEPTLPPATPSPPVAFSIPFTTTEQESGSCDYSCTRLDVGSFPLEVRELMEIVQDVLEDGGSLLHLVESIAEEAQGEAADLVSGHDGTDDYEYINHECAETSDFEASFNNNAIRAQVEAYLRQNNPELLTQLNNNA
jgi:hypothetical protein